MLPLRPFVPRELRAGIIAERGDDLGRGKDEGAPERLGKKAWFLEVAERTSALPWKRSSGHLDGNDYCDMTEDCR